jgi:molybdopterin-guanine dinucleotide biosynthesis protein A
VIPLRDEGKHYGPLGGLTAALESTRSKHLLALASDLPNMTTEYLRGLLDKAKPGLGTIPKTGRIYQPLAAVYPVEALSLAQSCLTSHADKSMQHFVKELVEAKLILPQPVRRPEQALLQNLYEAPAKS